jgi:D-tyrosyl-tRNA(Tyr) deacylase
MRLVIQRVSRASLTINNQVHDSISNGLAVLIGIEDADDDSDIEYLAPKLCALRIFADEEGKMNLDISQADGQLLIVSQFTLHALTRKGNRPSFIKAARPEKAIPLYEKFISKCAAVLGKPCHQGVFGADMRLELVNDGPVTIIMDSRNKE